MTTIAEGLHVDGSAVPDDDTNIAIRAGKALVAHHRLDDRAAEIQVRKSIPVAGGMAGGSADAAATLVALDRLWNLDTSDDELLASRGPRLGRAVRARRRHRHRHRPRRGGDPGRGQRHAGGGSSSSTTRACRRPRSTAPTTCSRAATTTTGSGRRCSTRSATRPAPRISRSSSTTTSRTPPSTSVPTSRPRRKRRWNARRRTRSCPARGRPCWRWPPMPTAPAPSRASSPSAATTGRRSCTVRSPVPTWWLDG